MNFGSQADFWTGPNLPFLSCVTLGLSFYFLSSLRHITGVRKIVKDSVVLIGCEVRSTGPYS